MRNNGFRHITAFLLAYGFLLQAIFILIPDEEKVLCLAGDHIAVEVRVSWAVETSVSTPQGLFPVHAYHHPGDGLCRDISLHTHTLVPDSVRLFSPGGVLLASFLSGGGGYHAVIRETFHTSVVPPGPPLKIPDRYADRNRVLLI